MSSYHDRLARASTLRRNLPAVDFPGAGYSDHPKAQPVIVNGYDPAREIACRQVKMSYGEVFVSGMPAHARSHEMNTNGDGRGFIPPAQLQIERAERRAWRGDGHRFTGTA